MKRQKFAIRVHKKSAVKLMKIAERYDGVELALKGDGRDEMEIIGLGVDPIKFCRMMNKKGGYAELLWIRPAENELQATSAATTSTTSSRNEGSMDHGGYAAAAGTNCIPCDSFIPCLRDYRSRSSLQCNADCCLHIPSHKFAYKFSERDAYLLIVN